MPTVTLLLGLLSIGAASAPPPAPTTVASPPKSEPTLLVLDPRVEGLPSETATTVGQLVASSAPGRVVTYDDIKQLLALDAQQELLGCKEDGACLARAADAAKTDLVLASALGLVGSQYLLTLRLLDTRNAQVIARQELSRPTLAELLADLPATVAALWGSQGAARRYSLPNVKSISFAVFDLVASGLPETISRNLTQVLSTEVKRVQGASVISRDDIVAMLQAEAEKSMLGCTQDNSCLAEIGGALGVDKLIIGQVGMIGEQYVVSLRLIDAPTARVENRVSELFVGQAEQLIPAVRQAGRQVLGLRADEPGSLIISANETAGQATLDGNLIGLLPLPPIPGLAPGRHRLSVLKDGFLDWSSDIFIDPAETAAVWVRLEERPWAWYQEWWVWTAVGAVVLGATGLTAYLVSSGQAPPATGLVTVDGL